MQLPDSGGFSIFPQGLVGEKVGSERVSGKLRRSKILQLNSVFDHKGKYCIEITCSRSHKNTITRGSSFRS